MSNQNNILGQIAEQQQQYYERNAKTSNIFYKKEQKMDCASNITKQFDINVLFNSTTYIIPNTNKVFIDYAVFKTYATPEICDSFIDKITDMFDTCIDNYNSYEVHLNLASITITACERYKNVFNPLIHKSLIKNNIYATNLSKFYLYNPPNIMDTVIRIIAPFTDNIVKQKIILISKVESEQRILELFTPIQY